jgi:Spy/CpxP family protein refolding chaperone
MKDKVILIIMIVSLAFNLGVLAMFGTFIIRGYISHHQGPLIEEDMKRRLDLTPEQEEEIEEIRGEMHNEIEPLRKEMEKKRREAFNLLQEPELDIEKRDRLFTEIADLQIQIEMAMFNHLHGIKGELTPEQQEIFLDTMEERICPKGGPMGPGPGRGPGRPGFRGEGKRGPMNNQFDERRRGKHYEEMERETEGNPDKPGNPGGNPDSNEPGDHG